MAPHHNEAETFALSPSSPRRPVTPARLLNADDPTEAPRTSTATLILIAPCVSTDTVHASTLCSSHFDASNARTLTSGTSHARRKEAWVAHRDAAQCAISFALPAASTSPPSPCDHCPHRALIPRSGIAGSLSALVLSKSAATSSCFGFGAEKGNVDCTDPHVLIISGILHFIGGPPPRRRVRAAAARHVVAHAHAHGEGERTHTDIHSWTRHLHEHQSQHGKEAEAEGEARGRSLPALLAACPLLSPTTIIAPPYSFFFYLHRIPRSDSSRPHK
ncbi:hypothetical protein B0H14DRAFT_3495672 [Mycena olivaceomarginata]|nr:hypothetical protein B0H14DRAFT_3495672 [Mycena olivaceomarginata]